MRKYLISAIVVLFSGQLFASELPESGALKSAISLYETWLKAQMEYKGIPGCSFAIVYDQKLVYSKGYGYMINGNGIVTGQWCILILTG